MNGPCVGPANHAKNAPFLAELRPQVPPNTNPDDTRSGIYAEHRSTRRTSLIKSHGFDGATGQHSLHYAVGESGGHAAEAASLPRRLSDYTAPSGWTVGGADMLAFEGRTSSTFSRTTLLTSYPAGSSGLPSNIIVPGGNGIQTNGFTYARAGYANPSGSGFSA